MNSFFRRVAAAQIARLLTMLARLLTTRPLPRTATEWRLADFTFAQFAEDILVIRALESLGVTETGFYVDVGAYHPVMYSNTQLLNILGWKGINIDAQSPHVEHFNKERPDDINLHCAVSSRSGFSDFLCYDSGTTGRLAPDRRDDFKSILGETVRAVVSVPTEPLATLLRKHAPPDKLFGFLSIDCEGHELEVLRSNDWDAFEPCVVAVEDHTKQPNSEIDAFLRARGYQLWAMAHVTKIFTHTRKHDFRR